MKKAAAFAAALVLICGMTGCGEANSESKTSVYTDIDIHDSNIIRHCIEQPEDAEEPDSWIYTELVEGNRIRYITSTETNEETASEPETVEESSLFTEIDIFDGAELEMGGGYPSYVQAEFHSKFDEVNVTYQIIEATPITLTIRVIADEKSQALTLNNYKLKETFKDYSFNVSEIPHILMSNDEITPEIENELILGMSETIKTELETKYNESPAPAIHPVALYTTFPDPRTIFLPEDMAIMSTCNYTLPAGKNCEISGIFASDQGEYYFVHTGSTSFGKDGTWDVANVNYTLDVDYAQIADGGFGYKDTDFDSAYSRVEKRAAYIQEAEPCALQLFRKYTD